MSRGGNGQLFKAVARTEGSWTLAHKQFSLIVSVKIPPSFAIAAAISRVGMRKSLIGEAWPLVPSVVTADNYVISSCDLLSCDVNQVAFLISSLSLLVDFCKESRHDVSDNY